MDIDQTIKKQIKGKADYIMKKIRPLFKGNEGRFIIAGGCLAGGQISDIDCFPLNGEIPELNDKAKLVCKTKNSRTFTTDTWPIQLCNYQKPTVKELVESFDFAHIQLGAVIKLISYSWKIEEVAYTDDYLNSLLTQNTRYCGSEYPLSSLIRAQKYYDKGIIKNKNGYVDAVVACLSDVIKRGVNDYEDFKDQLDSIDLAILPEDLSGLSKRLMGLYELLLRND